MEKEETLLQTLAKIRNEWDLTDAEIAHLIRVDLKTYLMAQKESHQEVSHLPLIPAGLDSAMPLISIYKSLEKSFSNPEDRLKWLFTENPDFDQHKPFDILASSVENLFWVSYYLASKQREKN